MELGGAATLSINGQLDDLDFDFWTGMNRLKNVSSGEATELKQN